MKRRWFIFFLLFFSYHSSLSQTINSQVEIISTLTGLTDNTVTALFQDSRGFMWIATENGLNRFDGRSLKPYKTIGEGGLTDHSIKCITEDADGNIWVGTDFGTNKIDPFTEKISRYYEGTGPGTVPYKRCNYLYADKEKNIWFSSEKGIALYNKQTNSFTNYPVSVYGADKKINKYIFKILEDSKGRFWLATSYGVKLFDRKTRTYISYHHEKMLSSPYENNIYSLCEDKDGNIWAGHYGAGLLKYDHVKDVFETVKITSLLFSYGAITDIKNVTLQDQTLLLAVTTSGLFSIEPSPDGVYDLRKIITLPNENINCAHQISSGPLWVGSQGGLVKIKTGSRAFQWISSPTDQRELVSRIIPDIKNPQQIYFTQLSGWSRMDLTKKKAVPFALPVSGQKLLNSINRWQADENGYWVTSLYGFGYYNIYKNQFTDFTQLVQERSGQVVTGFIADDPYNNVWLTMRRSGLLVYNRVTQQSTVMFGDSAKRDNIFGVTVNDLQKGSDGYIYFTCDNGLYKINPVDQSYKVISPLPELDPVSVSKLAPRQLHFAGKKIFVSSILRIYELRNDTLTPVYPPKGYSYFNIISIKGNKKGDIWLNTSEGVFKTDTSFKKLVSLNAVINFNGEIRDTYVKEDGEILFAEIGGVGILTESLIGTRSNPGPPIISRVKYGKTENYLVSLKPVNIRSSFKDAIEIELSHPGFMDITKSKLFYKLEGWDNDWKELITGSVVRYEQLPPGHYTFKSKTISAEEKEGEETSFKFRIIPPFYRTWWFISLVIATVAASIIIIYRYRLRKAVEMERLRTRIATDLHDDIGATLSSISMYSEAVKNQVKEKMPQLEAVLNKMGENSREMVTSMSDIVWAINPKNDSGEKLTQRMESYARDVCAVKNVHLLFSANEKINDIILSLEQRKNIYLIFKEALNNALKYSLATQIAINLDYRDNEIELIVKDNGKGFNTELASSGNGLRNMQQRAGEISSRIFISSAQNEGTLIKLVCPL